MAMDAATFGRRIALSKTTKFKPSDVARALLAQGMNPHSLTEAFDASGTEALVAAVESSKLRWARHADIDQRAALYAQALSGKPYLEWLDFAERAEQLDQERLYAPIWTAVNAHLDTSAHSIPELVEQLGIARFGKRPIVGDAFCGGGSIPFEAARLGFDAVASDLNPIACMLSWGALNIVGANAETRTRIDVAQANVAAAVDAEISALQIEHNARGDRAKAYLYCLETRCPQTGYLVPMLPSRVISRPRKIVAALEPDDVGKRFNIRVLSGVSDPEMAAAETGTVGDGDLVVSLNGETYRTPIKTIRGDRKDTSDGGGNSLRLWTKEDFMPMSSDIFQERLYAVQWITRETLGTSRQETYIAAVTADDLARERTVEELVRKDFAAWQERGFIPDMPIEKGDETTRLFRERGWTHWHHLFGPRELLTHALFASRRSAATALGDAKALDWLNRLCHWHTTWEKPENLFYNQAFNTFFNWGVRAFTMDALARRPEVPIEFVAGKGEVHCAGANVLNVDSDYWITDPPYADAVRYEEITEFFIAWLRKNPPEPFKDWVWDSRRALAIKGSGESFKTEMIAAYKNLAAHMPDNGRQIVMFTHQDAEVWADMAAIMWGAGLQVTAAWYVATETTSELKKGGYVQGTVLLVLRKRLEDQAGYRDEITQEITAEVARQIESLTGLNDRAVAHGRSENLFEDADLQMAGYAAALRVLTAYSRIDGEEMAAYAARPRVRGRTDPVKEIIDFAADAANSNLVPREFPRDTWATLTPDERFYFKMVDLEAVGLKKLDNYQNFAKAFRADWEPLMASREPNSARLKTSAEFGKTQFGDGFGETSARAILWAMHQLQEEDANGKAVLEELRTTPRYYDRREDLKAITIYLGAKRADPEGEAARTLAELIENERLG
jgi:putative DNA methylase